jgi:hypothetical protein
LRLNCAEIGISRRKKTPKFGVFFVFRFAPETITWQQMRQQLEPMRRQLEQQQEPMRQRQGQQLALVRVQAQQLLFCRKQTEQQQR